MKKILLLISVLVLLNACDSDRVYEKYEKFPDQSWNRFDNLEFEIPVGNINSTYDIYITIRHITQYPYKNLLITTILNTPSGEVRFMDYDLQIRDKEGKPLGESTDDRWEIKILLRKSFKFRKAGTFTIEIENRMSKMETTGILGIGVIVEKGVRSRK
jgi:gliding motility-associated lipoprotein GldH